MDQIIEKLTTNVCIRLVGSNARKELDASAIEFVTILKVNELKKVIYEYFSNVQFIKNDDLCRKYAINNIVVIFWRTIRGRYSYTTIYRTLPKKYISYLKNRAREQKKILSRKGLFDLKTKGKLLDWKKIIRLLQITSPNIISICDQN